MDIIYGAAILLLIGANLANRSEIKNLAKLVSEISNKCQLCPKVLPEENKLMERKFENELAHSFSRTE